MSSPACTAMFPLQCTWHSSSAAGWPRSLPPPPTRHACRRHALQRRQGVAAGHAAGGAHALQVAGRPAWAPVPPGPRLQVPPASGRTASGCPACRLLTAGPAAPAAAALASLPSTYLPRAPASPPPCAPAPACLPPAASWWRCCARKRCTCPTAWPGTRPRGLCFMWTLGQRPSLSARLTGRCAGRRPRQRQQQPVAQAAGAHAAQERGVAGVGGTAWHPASPPTRLCFVSLQGVMRRGEDGSLLARTVSHAPTQHKHVPDGMAIDTGRCCAAAWPVLCRHPAVLCCQGCA